MAEENSDKNQPRFILFHGYSPEKRVVLSLRLLALVASATAAMVMGLNNQTTTFVIATIGTTIVKTTLTAKFSHVPAFVFFVVVNGCTAVHNLLIIMADLSASKKGWLSGLGQPMIAILDLLNLGLMSGGVGAAASMAELGRNGNSYAQWGKICDKFSYFCHRGGGSIIASSAGVLLLLTISFISVVNQMKSNHVNVVVTP